MLSDIYSAVLDEDDDIDKNVMIYNKYGNIDISNDNNNEWRKEFLIKEK